MANRFSARFIASQRSGDDQQELVVRRDISGGVNTTQSPSMIGETQATVLTNIDLSTAGKRKRRGGSVLIGNDVGANSFVQLFQTDSKLVGIEGANVRYWTGSGNWSAPIYTGISGTDVGVVWGKESGHSPDDIVIVQDGVGNARRALMDGTIQDLGSTAGTGSDSPPKSTVMAWYGNRFWILKNDLLYWSDAYASDYSNCWDTVSGSFRIPVGEERGIVPTRDMGLVCLGKHAIWALMPSAVPSATDKPEPMILDYGCVSKKGWAPVGDDIYFFAQDGLRAVKRTIQDKLQLGSSAPISYFQKDEFNLINWSRITELSMISFHNMLLISVPVDASSFRIWVYYPEGKCFSFFTGWNPSCWAKFQVNGEERLYYGKSGDGTAYRALYGYTDEGTTTSNGTAIVMTEEGRDEDFGKPHLWKEGAELEIKAEAVGNYDISVYASFDNGGYEYLGKINLGGNLVTFPVTFPVTFLPPSIAYEKFHLDSYGRFRTVRIKLEYSTTSDTHDIIVLETILTAFSELYNEE